MNFARFLFVALLVTVNSACASAQSSSTTAAKVDLIVWGSEASTQRFERASKADFFSLTNNFEAQVNKFYCGPTSAVIVLNAFRPPGDTKVAKPQDPKLYRGVTKTLPPKYNPVFERYTQDAFFSERVNKVKSQAQVFGGPQDAAGNNAEDYGFQLNQFANALRAHDLKVQMQVVADNVDSAPLRKAIIENLRRKGDYVLVNYARKALGQPGGGHISPLAMYDEKTDSVLIMDVNPSAQPWVWVDLDDVIAAMRTKDTVENRGYLEVSEGL